MERMPRRAASGGPLAGLVLCLVIVGLLGSPGAAQADEGVDALLGKLAEAYKDVPSIEATFVQTSTGMSYMEPMVQKGTLSIERPGKMRWDFTEPTKQQYISDGTTLWVVSEADKTCTIYRSMDGVLSTYFDFLTGMADVREHFTVRLGEPVGEADVLVLKPLAADSTLGTMKVRIDRASGLVASVVSVTPFGDQTEVVLSDVKTGRDLPDESFTWSGREGYREVEGG